MGIASDLFRLGGFVSLISAPYIVKADHSCPNVGPSCPYPPPSSIDPCCTNSPAGHFLFTQFWDSDPAPLGPDDSWTIHGLWPNDCNKGYPSFCDPKRAYNNITAILEGFDTSASSSDSSQSIKSTEPQTDLVKYMSKYWLALNDPNEHLWSHEWTKHGTCVSTLAPKCYSSSSASSAPTPSSTHDDDAVDKPISTEENSKFEDVLDYFTYTSLLHRSIDTYSVLAKAGIQPSKTKTYTLPEIIAALMPSHDGYAVTLRCSACGNCAPRRKNQQQPLRQRRRRGGSSGSSSSSGSINNTEDPTANPNHRQSGRHGNRYRHRKPNRGNSPNPNPEPVDSESNMLTEIWYHYLIQGPLRNAPTFNASSDVDKIKQDLDKVFIATNPAGTVTNCPATGIRWLPKTAGSKESELYEDAGGEEWSVDDEEAEGGDEDGMDDQVEELEDNGTGEEQGKMEGYDLQNQMEW